MVPTVWTMWGPLLTKYTQLKTPFGAVYQFSGMIWPSLSQPGVNWRPDRQVSASPGAGVS